MLDDTIRVLHIDDDPDFLDLASTFLEREDEEIRVITEKNVEEGLESLANQRVDCVVSDYDMPNVNGLEFLERVRESYPDLPFILFTGKGSEEIASEAISAGVTDYIQKQTGTNQYTVLANRIRNTVAQNRAERAVEETRRRFRTLIENSSDVICIVDSEGVFEYLTPPAEEVLGYRPDELVGENGFEYIHPEDREDAMEKFFDAVEDPSVEPTAEFRFKHKDRSWVVLEARGRNLLDDPTIEGIVVYVRDITERKLREEEIERTKNKIESLHHIANRIEACETEEEICQLTVEAAEGILDFDRCAVMVERDGYLSVEAISDKLPEEDIDPMSVEEGLAGKTYRDQESYLVNNLETADEAKPQGPFLSGISVPIDRWGVFQVGSEDPDSFTEEDLEMVELLISHVAHGINRVQSKEELTEERDRLSALFENTTDCIVETEYVDGEPIVRRVNSAFEKVFGYSAEEIKGKSLDDFIVPPGKKEEAKNINQQVYQTSRLETEVRRKTKEGMRDFLLRAVPFKTDEGRAKTYAVYTDITERKEREETIRKERDRFATLFESIPEPVVHVKFEESEPIVQNINSAFEDVFGYDSGTLVGKSTNEFIVPEKYMDEAHVIDRKTETKEIVEREVQRKTAKGEIRDFLFRAIPFRRGKNETSESIGVYIDITEQKEREEELERQNERLEEFASVVSHDLRNPLNVARGNMELMKVNRSFEYLDNADRALDRMERLIDDLLTLARQGQTIGDIQEIRLKGAVKESWRTVDVKGAELEIEDNLGVIEADYDRLCQMFENLFRNAVEHAGEGVKVQVGMLEGGNGFYVEDNGPGIPEEEHEKVFESGYSTSQEGTGFGLTIVKGIVEAHDWNISITGGEEGGARFEISWA